MFARDQPPGNVSWVEEVERGCGGCVDGDVGKRVWMWMWVMDVEVDNGMWGMVGENLYGVHPMYLVVEENGSSHAVLWLNSNAMEAETMPLPGLTLRSIGGIIDLFFFLGPTPEQVVAQYTSVIGRPFLPPYWSLGFQLCRYGYNSLENLTSAVSRTRRHGIPQLPAGEYPVHEAGVANDVYITWPEGEAPDENFGAGDVMLGYVWPDNRTAFPDFFRQKTRDWWTEQIVDFHKTLEFDGLWI
ncbi:hypothetical protein C7M84_017493 [Penaeus vannamei]|uniref:Glycoside hydrolase family 31 TIM barrel domain-containing protein n=1 Tax=Penaeus vannamei TaxID=6689 RepID=A0A423SK71_PENVA|nr:hypothetical protein C7M84_017493 [Penaeus vannamei]